MAGKEAEKPKRIETETSRIVAGALFDFLGYLTTRQKGTAIGSHHDASKVLDMLQTWAVERGFSLEEAYAQDWQERLDNAQKTEARLVKANHDYLTLQYISDDLQNELDSLKEGT
jgi:hypothetical protein